MIRVLPILFKTDMVRAILDGRKTTTRRLMKNPPHPDMPDNHNYCRMQFFVKDHLRTLHYMDVIEQNPFRRTRYFESLAPYDKGDILYVREAWAQVKDVSYWNKYHRLNKHPISPEEYIYRADNIKVDGILPEMKWRPSIHMPKEAARIWLRVTDVRVERLQDISAYEVLKEGVDNAKSNPAMGKRWENMQMIVFSELWDSTIKKSDQNMYGWAANPWVWVIEFEQCKKPEGEQ